jgi:hypothetical protein
MTGGAHKHDKQLPCPDRMHTMDPEDIMTNAHQMFGAKNVVSGVMENGLVNRDVGESIRWRV